MALAPGVMSGRRSLVHRNDVAPTWNAPRECSRPSFAQQAVLTCTLPATKKKAREGGFSLFEKFGRNTSGILGTILGICAALTALPLWLT